MPSKDSQRLVFIDLLKTLGSQLIVLHHLAFYGPMSDRVLRIAPDLIAWFSDHARIAVQVFLVVGGFLATKSLAPDGRLRAGNPVALVGKRYLRLAIPYVSVLVLAILCAWIARNWMQHDSIPAPASAPQVLAHLFLLQDVLDLESLSAGLWYVAIDMQLFAMLLAAFWLARRVEVGSGAPSPLAPAMVGALALSSLFVFNRNPAWDWSALYFFGAYGMGAGAFWISTRRRSVSALLWLITAAVAALAFDYRIRIAVALGVALLLVLASRLALPAQWLGTRILAFLGRIAYSVFLVHFPVCLVVNAIWVRFMPEAPWLHAVGMIMAWAASVVCGAIFYHLVESRVGAVIAWLRPLLRPVFSWPGSLARKRA